MTPTELLPDDARLDYLAWLLEGCVLRLYANDPKLSRKTRVADLREPAASGYAPKAIAAADWSVEGFRATAEVAWDLRGLAVLYGWFLERRGKLLVAKRGFAVEGKEGLQSPIRVGPVGGRVTVGCVLEV